MPRGTILTPNMFRNQYRGMMRDTSGFNVWNSAYNTVGMYEKASQDTLDYDYNKAVADAYAAAHSERNLVAESGLGKGFKDALYSDIDENLVDAYAQYRQNYLENSEKVAEIANEYRQGITSDLETTSQNTYKIENSLYDYLQYLYENKQSMFTDDTNKDRRWSRYIVDEVDETGKPIGKRLMTKQELLDMNFDESSYEDEFGNTQYEYTLGQKGLDYYDLLLNFNEQDSDILNYEAWLYDESQNEKGDYAGLYDWYKTYNPYASGLNNPTNAGLIRTAFGLASTDYAYQFAERFGGMSEDEIKSMYKQFEDKANELQEAIDKHGKDKGKGYIQEISSYVSEIKKMADNFGILDELDEQLKDIGGWDGLTNSLDDLVSKSRTSKEMAGDWFKSFGISMGAGAAAEVPIAVGGAAAMAGAGVLGSILTSMGVATAASAAFPPAAVVMTIITAVVALSASVIGGSVTVDNERKQNKMNAQLSNELFRQLVAEMTNVSLAKKKEADINFYKTRKNQYI